MFESAKAEMRTTGAESLFNNPFDSCFPSVNRWSLVRWMGSRAGREMPWALEERTPT